MSGLVPAVVTGQRPHRESSRHARVLFVSPTSALSPLLQSQGIPHIRELAERGTRFTLLTVEDRQWSAAQAIKAKVLGACLSGWGVQWLVLRRFGHVPWIPSSVPDVVIGSLRVLEIVKRQTIDIVHCRSYVAAYMVLLTRRLARPKFIFDMRGFLPDEYVESGYWVLGDWRYKLAKKMEGMCFRSADAIIVTCHEMRERVMASVLGEPDRSRLEEKVWVVPNCVDTSRFRPDASTRATTRRRLGLEGATVILWVVGGVKSWHMPQEIGRFFAAARTVIPDARLLVLSQTPNIGGLLRSVGLEPSQFGTIDANPEEMPGLMLAGDVGLSFISPGHPGGAVKLGEYLASGLPVIVDGWHAEIAALIDTYGVGVVVSSPSQEGYEDAARKVQALLSERPGLASRCRMAATSSLSLDIAVNTYASIYESILRT